MDYERIAIIGAGAWGAALANTIARAGRTVTLVARDRATTQKLAAERRSPRLPEVPLDERVKVTAADADIGAQDAVLLAVPSQQLRIAATTIAPKLAAGTPVVACAKGIERGTHKFMTEVIVDIASSARPAILSGPSFAIDVARGLPTAVT